MIIKKYNSYFTVKLEKEDWYYYSIHTLLELLKSIPKEHRTYNPLNKVWSIDMNYYYIIENMQIYTQEEDCEGEKEYNLFISLLGDNHTWDKSL